MRWLADVSRRADRVIYLMSDWLWPSHWDLRLRALLTGATAGAVVAVITAPLVTLVIALVK